MNDRDKRETPTKADKPPYHHGDLRKSLIDAARHLVETEGADACTLKEASRRAGVSVAAPYRHFPDKAALLTEVAGSGFHRLHTVTVAARDQHPARSIEGLIAMGQAYVGFAAANPHLFRLMFDLQGEHSSDMVRQAKERAARDGADHETAFEAFLETVLAIIQRLGGSPDHLMALAMPLWSTVHGAACLLINEGFARTAPDSITPDRITREVVETAARYFLKGYQAQLKAGQD